jgi:hypothetical protein
MKSTVQERLKKNLKRTGSFCQICRELRGDMKINMSLKDGKVEKLMKL